MTTQAETLTPQAAAEALRWWHEAGVDLALDETPHDRFAEPPPKPAPAAIASPAPMRAPALAASTAPDEAARNARELAQAAQSLDELRAALDSFAGCA